MNEPTSQLEPPGSQGAPAPRPLIELTPEAAERLRDPRLVLAIVAVVAGAIALLLGWYGVSGTFDPGVQMSYLVSGGLGGLFLAGVGAALVSSSNMRQATRKVDDLQRGMDELRDVVVELRAMVAEQGIHAPTQAPIPPRAPNGRRTRKAPTSS
jgi:hypothetical protein